MTKRGNQEQPEDNSQEAKLQRAEEEKSPIEFASSRSESDETLFVVSQGPLLAQFLGELRDSIKKTNRAILMANALTNKSIESTNKSIENLTKIVNVSSDPLVFNKNCGPDIPLKPVCGEYPPNWPSPFTKTVLFDTELIGLEQLKSYSKLYPCVGPTKCQVAKHLGIMNN